MIKTIFKYPLRLGLNEIAMPGECNHLCAQMQDGALQMWSEVEPSETLTNYNVLVVGTGQQFDPDMCAMDLVYLSTVQDGDFVWHVYA